MTHEHQPNSQSRPAHGKPEDYEGLTPLEPLDLSKIDGKGISDMLYAFEKMPFSNREWGKGAALLEKIVKDPDTFSVLTLSGAMIPAQKGLVITDMIDDNWFQLLVGTGATMAHGFVQSAGMQHFWAEEPMSDEEANARRMNRIHRAYEPEDNLDGVEVIFNSILSELPTERVYSSRYFTHKLGEYLHQNVEGRGILKSCFEKGVPVLVPAFTDSELGLDVGLYNHQRSEEGKPMLQYNDFNDLDFYLETISRQNALGKKLAIVTIGGGVPRNYAQQVAPYIDLQSKRAHERNLEIPERDVRFTYGLRCCPDDVNLGGLSACTYSEGVSWGKFWPDPEKKNLVEILADAVSTMPWLVKAVQYRTNEKPVKKNVFTGPSAIAEIEASVEKRYNPSINPANY